MSGGTWFPESAVLRWYQPTGRLQQVWVCFESGEREWRDVPVVTEENNTPLQTLESISSSWFIEELRQKRHTKVE